MINDLTLVIVAYKSLEVIKKNINNLKVFKVIIFDNSNDNNLKLFLKDFPNIKYINSKKNIGFAKANNIAVNDVNTEYIFLVNPDTSFNENSVKMLLDTFNRYQNVGIVVPAVYSALDKRVDNVNFDYIKRKVNSKIFTKNKISNHYTFSSGDICCENVSCSAFMFKTSFYKQLKGFDESFFMFFEDNDMCKKVISNNKIIVENPNSKIYHYGHSSGDYSNADKINIIFSHKLSEYIFLKKYINKRKLILLLLINFIDYFQRIIFNLIKFKFYNSFKNLLRCISIIYFLIFKFFFKFS